MVSFFARPCSIELIRKYFLGQERWHSKRKIGMYGGKFLPVHLGHVNAMVMASTIVDELHVVVSFDEEYEKKVFEGTGMKPISAVQRLRLVE